MIEISLLDLKDFISSAREFGTDISEFSLANLRVKLHNIATEYKLHSFIDFIFRFSHRADFRQHVIADLFMHPRELFRDAGLWRDFILNEKSQLENPNCKLLLIDHSYFSDTVNFQLCLSLLNIEVKAKLYWSSYTALDRLPVVYEISKKELEAARDNFSCLQLNCKIEDCFRKTASGFFFQISDKWLVCDSMCFPLKDAIESNKFDIIISQNNSLIYNYEGQQRLFEAYLNKLKFNGSLFVGRCENFKSCNEFSLVSQPNPTLNRFLYDRM